MNEVLEFPITLSICMYLDYLPYILDAWLSSLLGLAFTDYLITIFRYIGSLVNYICQ